MLDYTMEKPSGTDLITFCVYICQIQRGFSVRENHYGHQYEADVY
jgi:hypothetical protein